MVIHFTHWLWTKTLLAAKNFCLKHTAPFTHSRMPVTYHQVLWTCGKNVSDKMSESVAKIWLGTVGSDWRHMSAVILRFHLSCILVTSNPLPLYRSLQIKPKLCLLIETTDRKRSDQPLCWKKPTDSPPDRSTSLSDSIGVFHRLKDNTTAAGEEQFIFHCCSRLVNL